MRLMCNARMFQITERMASQMDADRGGLNRWYQQPLVSGALVIVNVIVYIVCMFTGNRLYNMGDLNVFSVLRDGEYGRILWAMFLHVDRGHLFNNMLILFFLGAMIEKEIGHIKYAFLYFLSGIGGNLLSLYSKMMTGEIAGSVGASGAVFGLDGVLLAMVLFWKKELPSVTPVRVAFMILLSLYSGFTGANVDNMAHLGGLIIGFAGGCVVCMLQIFRQEST